VPAEPPILVFAGVPPGAQRGQTSLATFGTMVRKRADWLVRLFPGEMLTAMAMGHFEVNPHPFSHRRADPVKIQAISPT
jgi:Mg/Co/Ni transporter MgtE